MDTRRVYGEWAGNPKGTKENVTRCIEEVFDGFAVFYQCKRGHGENGLYCKQHSKNHPAQF